MFIVIREKRSGTEVWLSLEKVAQQMGLSPEEIEWTVEPHRPPEALRRARPDRRHPTLSAKASVFSSRRFSARTD